MTKSKWSYRVGRARRMLRDSGVEEGRKREIVQLLFWVRHGQKTPAVFERLEKATGVRR